MDIEIGVDMLFEEESIGSIMDEIDDFTVGIDNVVFSYFRSLVVEFIWDALEGFHISIVTKMGITNEEIIWDLDWKDDNRFGTILKEYEFIKIRLEDIIYIFDSLPLLIYISIRPLRLNIIQNIIRNNHYRIGSHFFKNSHKNFKQFRLNRFRY